jgi:hypothetical protein
MKALYTKNAICASSGIQGKFMDLCAFIKENRRQFINKLAP